MKSLQLGKGNHEPQRRVFPVPPVGELSIFCACAAGGDGLAAPGVPGDFADRRNRLLLLPRGRKTGRLPAVVRAGAVRADRRRESRVQPRRADDPPLSPVRKPPDARVHFIRSWCRAHALHGAHLVFRLHAGHDVRQIRLSVRKNRPGAESGPLHDAPLRPALFRAGKTGFQSAGRRRKRHAHGKPRSPRQMRADGLLNLSHVVA